MPSEVRWCPLTRPLKSAWVRAKSRAESLAMLIKEGDDYAWANNPENVGMLEEALGELRVQCQQ